NVVVGGIRKAELTVEVQPEKLVEYDTTLAEIARRIRETNLDLPAGTLKTVGENIAIRTLGESDKANQIAETIIRTSPSGRVVRVRDVGQVIDGFEDVDLTARYNGRPCVDVTVYKTGDQDAIEIANKVKAYVAGKMHQELPRTFAMRFQNALGNTTPEQEIYAAAAADAFPPGMQLEIHSNLARFIEGRLELLTRNAVFGLILVFVSLLLFLNWRVAFWVMIGLLISVCGALMLMQMLGASLNLISMFGLIVVLGLLVDDAIVVGENIYARVEHGEDPHLAAVRGAEEVAWPVTIAVMTTVGAFFPLLFIEGQIGDFFGVLPIVVMCALAVSLLESLSILPSHLADWLHPMKPREVAAAADSFGRRLLTKFFLEPYEKILHVTVRYRYVSAAILLALLMITMGLFMGLDNTGKPIPGGRVKFVFIQNMDSETLLANLEMPIGTPVAATSAAMKKLENVILDRERFPEISNMFSLIGAQVQADEGGATASANSHLAQAIIELTPSDQRDKTSDQLINEFRAAVGVPQGVNSLRFNAIHGGPAGAEIEIEVTGRNEAHLKEVSDELKAELAKYEGVFDIDDDNDIGRREMRITLRDAARPLGLSTQSLATEVRGAFFGIDARTLQRDDEDVDIRVRFPESRRRNIYELEQLRIATPLGGSVPLTEIAEIEEDSGYSALRRVNQRRAITVSADVDQTVTTADLVLGDMAQKLEQLRLTYPGTRIDFAGKKLESRKSFGSLKRDFLIALAIIYVMLAGLFRSYLQPFVVLTAVPFGMIGAVWGHLVMGYPLTILSIIGIVALSGIVVNDSLIMVDFINKEIARGSQLFDAVITAGKRRLRPILLTSATTILGLGPLMLEQSFQAKFLIPMAISISFGLLFATLLTLLVVPSFYLILHDLKTVAARIFVGRVSASEQTPAPA
ncbi:MAG: efflux RND transporter permease subunit, partial [Phycisphaerae bacterium]